MTILPDKPLRIVYLYLPPIDNIGKDFLRQVFAEQKQLIALKDVRMINVPKWPEVNVKTIYEHYSTDEELMTYLPD